MSYQELDLAVLKHIVSDKKYALDFVHEADEKIFSPDIWRFSKIVLDYVKAYKEAPTRKVLFEKVKTQKNDSLLKYFNTVWDDLEKISVDQKEFKHNLEKIKNRFAYQLLYSLKDQLTESQDLDIKKTVDDLSKTVNQIKALNQVKAYEQKSLKESINDFRNKYVAKQTTKNFYGGFKTGYSFLDKTIGSIRESELFVIAAESGVGKSLFMMNLGINIWRGENNYDMETNFHPGADILYFSLEMPYDDMQQRCLASMARVPEVAIRDATLNEEQKKSVAKTLKFIEKYDHDFTIVDIPRGATMQTIESVFNDVSQTKKKPQVVIVDYMALLSHDQKDLSDWLQLNYLSEALHEFARAHNVVMITASQLNRPNDKKGQKENTGLHRLSRSSLIAANANFVAIIEKRQDENKYPDMPVHLVKSRRSALVSGTVYKELETCSLLNEPKVQLNDNSIFAKLDGDISDNIE